MEQKLDKSSGKCQCESFGICQIPEICVANICEAPEQSGIDISEARYLRLLSAEGCDGSDV